MKTRRNIEFTTRGGLTAEPYSVDNPPPDSGGSATLNKYATKYDAMMDWFPVQPGMFNDAVRGWSNLSAVVSSFTFSCPDGNCPDKVSYRIMPEGEEIEVYSDTTKRVRHIEIQVSRSVNLRLFIQTTTNECIVYKVPSSVTPNKVSATNTQIAVRFRHSSINTSANDWSGAWNGVTKSADGADQATPTSTI